MLAERCYLKALTRHVVVQDVFGCKVFANGQRWRFIEGIALCTEWRESESWTDSEQYENRSGDYTIQQLELFRKDIGFVSLMRSLGSVRLVLKMMRLVGLRRGWLSGWCVWRPGLALVKNVIKRTKPAAGLVRSLQWHELETVATANDEIDWNGLAFAYYWAGENLVSRPMGRFLKWGKLGCTKMEKST